ncbi:MAG TPA: ester cyclase family protein [Longimicrobium sp.]|nr:ester cyclase family protein [Longimicrobium sp.]
MDTTRNKELARRWFDAMNAGDLSITETLFSPDYRLHLAGTPDDARGPAAIRAALGAYRAALPDLRFTVHEIAGEGGTVVARWTAEGTHRGEIMGLAPTGRRVRWSGSSVLHFADGRITEDWVNHEESSLQAQLGAPRPGAATELIRAMHAAFDRRDAEATAALCTPDVEFVAVPLGQTFRGPEGVLAFQELWHRAFPDARTEIGSITDAGDRVAVEFTGIGTHTGPLAGPDGDVPPTGRGVRIRFCDFVELRDGRVARTRTYWDQADFAAQLGLAPEPAAAAA